MTLTRNRATFQLVVITVIEGQRQDVAAVNDTDYLTGSALIQQPIINFLLKDDGAEVRLCRRISVANSFFCRRSHLDLLLCNFNCFLDLCRVKCYYLIHNVVVVFT